MPKVSIIIPIYNTEKRLYACLDSIIAQSFSDYEAILVDDGSTDGSRRICEEYAAKDSRFVVVHKDNEGLASARITGFEHSKGDYITFIDSDDYVDKQYLGHLYECIIKNNADASGCQYYRVDHRGPKLSVRKNFGFFDKAGIESILIPGMGWDYNLGKESFTHILWSKMVKRCFVRQILDAGKGLWYGEDQCGALRMLYLVNSFYNSEVPLYYYVFHEGQVTTIMTRERWDAYVNYWERMVCEDTKGLFTPLLPYRIFEHLKRYLNHWFSNASSYQEFKNEALYALNSKFLDKHLFHANLKKLSNKEKFNYHLLKRKSIFLYYLSKKARRLFR